MHPYVLMLQYITAHGIVSHVEIIREFELEGNELANFISWVDRNKFAYEDTSLENGPFIVATINGMNWVVAQKRANNIYMIATKEAPADFNWHSAGIDPVTEIA